MDNFIFEAEWFHASTSIFRRHWYRHKQWQLDTIRQSQQRRDTRRIGQDKYKYSKWPNTYLVALGMALSNMTTSEQTPSQRLQAGKDPSHLRNKAQCQMTNQFLLSAIHFGDLETAIWSRVWEEMWGSGRPQSCWRWWLGLCNVHRLILPIELHIEADILHLSLPRFQLAFWHHSSDIINMSNGTFILSFTDWS